MPRPIIHEPVTGDIPDLPDQRPARPGHPAVDGPRGGRPPDAGQTRRSLEQGHHGTDGLSNLQCLDGLILRFLDKGSADGLDTSCTGQHEKAGLGHRLRRLEGRAGKAAGRIRGPAAGRRREEELRGRPRRAAPTKASASWGRRRPPCLPLSPIPNPSRASAELVFGDPGLEEVLLLREVDRLRHPGEGILAVVALGEAQALEAAVGDVLDVLGELVGVDAEQAFGAGVVGVALLEGHRLVDQLADLALEVGRSRPRGTRCGWCAIRSQPNARWMLSSRMMYSNCSPMPTILFCRLSASIMAKPA